MQDRAGREGGAGRNRRSVLQVDGPGEVGRKVRPCGNHGAGINADGHGARQHGPCREGVARRDLRLDQCSRGVGEISLRIVNVRRRRPPVAHRGDLRRRLEIEGDGRAALHRRAADRDGEVERGQRHPGAAADVDRRTQRCGRGQRLGRGEREVIGVRDGHRAEAVADAALDGEVAGRPQRQGHRLAVPVRRRGGVAVGVGAIAVARQLEIARNR